jgi:type VI secretion system protein ImpL
MNGFWAWLHLLDQSQLQTTSDPKTFQITFILDGNQAVYQLIADNPVNPYQSQLLASFRCPDSL